MVIIARALLSEKELIIFDELNSAKYLKNKTVIIISHREKENKIIGNVIKL